MNLPFASLDQLPQAVSTATTPRRASNVWAKRLLLIAAAWNILGGGGALIDPTANLAQLYPGAPSIDEPVAQFFFRCTWINVIAWGVGYAVAAYAPASRGAILAAGGIGKLAYFGACLSFVASGARPAVAITGVVDVLFAAGFAWILWSGSGEARATETPRVLAAKAEALP